MKKGDSIKIKSALQKEVCTNITIKGKKYLIITEDLVPVDNIISTKVYSGGKIVFSKDLDCSDVMKSASPDKELIALIRRQHDTIVQMLGMEASTEVKTPSDFLNVVKNLLLKKNNRRALELLLHALEQYPNDPFLLSYYGCLEAVVNKNYSYGIDTCNRALEVLKDRIPMGKEIFYPTFYLNLGRAYVAAGKKKNAVQAFQNGLKYNEEHKDLLWEAKKLGIRREPSVSFLKRSNPLNKYVGMILHKIKAGS